MQQVITRMRRSSATTNLACVRQRSPQPTTFTTRFSAVTANKGSGWSCLARDGCCMAALTRRYRN